MKPPDSKKSGGLLCYIKEKALITGMIKTLLWLRRLDLNQRPLAVPEKIFVLFAYLIFSTAAPSPAALHPPLSAQPNEWFCRRQKREFVLASVVVRLQAMPSRTLRSLVCKKRKPSATGIAKVSYGCGGWI